MLTGLDHAIIGLRDLDSAAALGNALGVVVSPGGRHPGWGTRNAIVRFGLDYLELIAVADEVEAAANPRGKALVERLRRGEGWLGFALASDDIEGDVAAIRARGIEVEAPQQGTRVRPSGELMAWRNARVAGHHWGSPLPFIIQHEIPPSARQAWAPPGGHPVGATRVASVLIACADLRELVDDYRRLLGREPDSVDDGPPLLARRATFVVGDLRIELLEPTARDSEVAEFVRAEGTGLLRVSLAVRSIDVAVDLLRSRGTAAAPPLRRRSALLDPNQTSGARFQLVEVA